MLNAYRAIYREISSYHTTWQARGYERDCARYGAIVRITAKYLGGSARLVQYRAPFHFVCSAILPCPSPLPHRGSGVPTSMETATSLSERVRWQPSSQGTPPSWWPPRWLPGGWTFLSSNTSSTMTCLRKLRNTYIG